MSKLEIVPLGGMGKVTQNMYLYIYDQEILIVDCGIGFPDIYMPGVDILIPDVYYLVQLLEQGKKIVGMVLTHGHDDHIAATPYILPELPGEFPIFASPLTAGFAKQRMQDGGVKREVRVLKDRQTFSVGRYFNITPYAVTHSVPDTKHFTIETPEGVIYHGSDFKIDDQPVDGVRTDMEALREVGKRGVLCMLIDCLHVELLERTLSESTTGPAIEKAMEKTQGKFIVTLMSSHIHRIQQAVNAAKKYHRKIVFIGRSVEQNVEIALELGKLEIPREIMIDKRDLDDYQDDELCVIIAGSQGQEGSSMMRAIFGEHRSIRINPHDLVVFSAGPIPGNELNYFGAIDELSRNQVRVLYPAVMPNLHQSGHASAPEQRDMVSLISPKYIMPIGGADRHRVKFKEFVTQPLGIDNKSVLLPGDGEIVSFSNQQVVLKKCFEVKPRMVDGKGIGDVGPVVLADRRALGDAGIIVLVIPKVKGHFDLRNMLVVSRGFVFMKEADEVIGFIKEETVKIINSLKGDISDYKLKQAIDKRLSKKLYKVIAREPLIVPVIYEVR
ncbi:ribonuclease J [Patescibacteria group bacterium]|nr:ribonuclease J [Patescibacteria group bacterium]MBU1967128.1 ribonuclease J [Patescibacteria group bacterium]MBU2543052.1 ribonuclease J [Patescibacteria group bacterium]